MSKRRGLLTLAGLAAGAFVARQAVCAYARARASCPPFRRRVYGSDRELLDAVGELWRQPDNLWSLRTNPEITRELAERLVLTVTGVNGCRYCSYVHAWYGTRQGLEREEVESLLSGDVEHVTVDQAPALFFAQQYTAENGNPDVDLVQRLAEAYGRRTAVDIITLIRLITVGNLVGNTFDALVSRALGKPAADSTLKSELLVLALFVFGIVPLSPLLMVRAAFSGPLTA